MDYYEELGLTKAATEEDIHKAHRRLSKLLHPDQQTDAGVKALAETQMRRLNGIVQVLANRESRLEYDREQNLQRAANSLVRFNAPLPLVVQQPFLRPPPPASLRPILTWALCSALGTLLFTLAGVWWWETRSGALFTNQVQAYDSRVAQSLNPATDFRPTNLNSEKSLAGEWVYVPHDQEQRSGVYLPESISLKLYLVNGQLQGEYHARYAVIDRPIPPDVNFTLVAAGTVENNFIWKSTSGAQGTLRIMPLGDNLIRTSWETTVYTRDSLLTSGAATLSRRQDS